MYIFVNFKEKELFENHKVKEVFANKAQVGYLYDLPSSDSKRDKNYLYWTPDLYRGYIEFQFRHEETFLVVVEQLKNFKYDNGYKYLVISCLQGEYGALDKNMLEKAGFKSLPDGNPEYLYLE